MTADESMLRAALSLVTGTRSDGSTTRGEVRRKAVLADGMWMIYVVVKTLPALPNPAA